MSVAPRHLYIPKEMGGGGSELFHFWINRVSHKGGNDKTRLWLFFSIWFVSDTQQGDLKAGSWETKRKTEKSFVATTQRAARHACKMMLMWLHCADVAPSPFVRFRMNPFWQYISGSKIEKVWGVKYQWRKWFMVVLYFYCPYIQLHIHELIDYT